MAVWQYWSPVSWLTARCVQVADLCPSGTRVISCCASTEALQAQCFVESHTIEHCLDGCFSTVDGCFSLSTAVSVLLNAVSVLSNDVSVLSNAVSVLSNDVSVLLTAVTVLSNAILALLVVHNQMVASQCG